MLPDAPGCSPEVQIDEQMAYDDIGVGCTFAPGLITCQQRHLPQSRRVRLPLKLPHTIDPLDWVREDGMTALAPSETEKAVHVTETLLGMIFRGSASQDVGVRLWDGTPWPDSTPRRATIVLKHAGALRRMFLKGTELALGEAYIYDDFDIEGEVVSVFGVADELTGKLLGGHDRLRLGILLLQLPQGPPRGDGARGPARLSGHRHSVARDRQAIRYHYDVSNDFYALWLDSRMVYSCGYFLQADQDVETAQVSKLDYICRKLRLKPGQRLLDLGCGWGGLVIHAADHYGVNATGITLSQPQADYANQKIEAAGLAGRCRVQVCDYREVDEPNGYDALVSVGMFEHVGAYVLPVYFAEAIRLLVPGGVFLNHGIARCATETLRPGPSFSDAYVFPDGELVPIHATLQAAEEAGFEVRDVESLREHYAFTLRHWVRRLEASHERALQFVDEPTYRVWRLFMAGSVYGFTTGSLNVYQALLLKPDEHGRSGLPLTRSDWY
jgi:cyclopropane-fatty-acyl-phospholipid synthase